MSTKILEYNFPLNLRIMQEDLDKYVNAGYIIAETIFIPEHESTNCTYESQLLVVLQKYDVNVFSGPYTFNIGGDI